MMRYEKLYQCPTYIPFFIDMVLDAGRCRGAAVCVTTTVENELPSFSTDSIIKYLFTLFSIFFTAEISEMGAVGKSSRSFLFQERKKRDTEKKRQPCMPSSIMHQLLAAPSSQIEQLKKQCTLNFFSCCKRIGFFIHYP
jgi:hypothetical protein